MSQCFTEAKPFNPKSLHVYGNTCSGHRNRDLDCFRGFIPRESSIKGYGSFGMPGGVMANVCRSDKMKSSPKEDLVKEGAIPMVPASSVASNGSLSGSYNLKAEDALKPNHFNGGDLCREESLREHKSGGCSIGIAGANVEQCTGRTREGATGSKSAASDNRTPASGEASNLTSPKQEVLSKGTPVQSWPNSPANLRGIPRTRNLSEGSFNMIFSAGESVNGTRSTVGSPSRSWSTEVGEPKASPALRTSSDGCLIGSIYSPVSTLEPVSRTKSCPVDSSEFGSIAKDLQFAAPSKASTRFSRDTGYTSGINIKMSENTETTDRKSAASTTMKLSEIQTAGASEASISQKAGTLQGIPVSSAFHDKKMNHGIITGGSFSRVLPTHPSVTSPKRRNLEGKVFPTFGNNTKGYQTGTKVNSAMSSYGNIMKNMGSDLKKPCTQENISLAANGRSLLSSALSSMDPEEVKDIGNEHYKRGLFTEALQLYERAINLLPGKALLHSNRAAALAAVGRLGDAVQECEDAIKLDPLCNRAHHRLASLYIRLGRAEVAKKHFKAMGNVCDQRDIQRCDIILRHVATCLELRMAKDWTSVIRESDATVVAGADSASKVFALKAEALLHLAKTDEAVRVIYAAQKVESSLNINTALTDPIVQIIQAEIDLSLGKFQEAIVTAEKAVQMDAKNLEASDVLYKARIMSRSRTAGNELYKAGKFFEASAAYKEGLERDPENSVLLCNRAACRSKLELYESAIEDCNAALTAQPNYIKARLRRAHCLIKLEQWEEAARDYEMLQKELPGDIEVARALFEVQAVRKKSREDSLRKSFGHEVQKLPSTNQVREAVNFPGLALLYFNLKDSDGCRQLSACIVQLCKAYPAVKFIKVDAEENRCLPKMENVTFLPTFQLYKNGRKVKEIEGPSYETLEEAIRHFML